MAISRVAARRCVRRILVSRMVIRDRQFQVFRDAAQANAEKKLVEHCREFAPGMFKAAGEIGIRQGVRLGIERAQRYGFEDEPQIRFYVDMMLVLGSEFDTDPQFPWATATLQDQFSRPHVRGMVLHRELSLYLDRVVGQGNEYLREALNRFAGLPPDLPPPDQCSVSNMRDWFGRLFPQKSDDLSDNQLAQISAAASQQAREYQLPGGDGILGGLMLVFGHGVTRDPLYPWIWGVLQDPRVANPDGRLHRLWAKLRVYAENAHQYLS